MKKIILLMLAIILLVSVAQAGTPQAKTIRFGDDSFNMTLVVNSLQNQMIVNIPKETLETVGYIDGIEFKCGRSYTNVPDGNLVIRIYKYNGVYEFLDSYSIPTTSCFDYGGYPLKLNFYDVINLQPDTDYAVGFYTTSTVGAYWLEGYYSQNLFRPYYGNWHNKYTGREPGPFPVYSEASSIISESITDTNRNQFVYDSNEIAHFYITVFGAAKFPDEPEPTPTPQPGDPGGPPIPGECSWEEVFAGECGIPLPPINTTEGSTGLGGNFSVPKQNICPDCIGNETTEIPGGTAPGKTGISQTFRALGYCKESGCDVYDIIDFAYDFSIFFIIVSFILVIAKFLKINKVW